MVTTVVFNTTTRFSFISTLSTNLPLRTTTKPPSLSVSCAKKDADEKDESKRRLSKQSSWEAKDSQGNDYLYRLGKEADNMNVAVGARAGVIDDLFAGNFLGRDSDIVFDYRQKVTRSFEYLQGDYYIAPLFMDKVGKFYETVQVEGSCVFLKQLYRLPYTVFYSCRKTVNSKDNRTKSLVQNTAKYAQLLVCSLSKMLSAHVCHIVKNYIAHLLNTKVPLILGIWGGKGQGKSFQTELIFQAMGIEPVIMSAGELESERAGEPGKLIRERYRTASQVVHNQGKMSCLMINDIDAGLGRFGNTQMTVNNQIVVGTLMNLSDNPTRVSVGQDWRESDITNRIPIIVTGNDFSTIYAPLIRDGRMDKFYCFHVKHSIEIYMHKSYMHPELVINEGKNKIVKENGELQKLGRQPNLEDIVNIVHRMYEKDGISRDDVISIVKTFPNQALDFYGALRSRTYDRSISKWIDDIGGVESLGNKLLKKQKDEKLPVFTPPEQTVEALLESGYSLLREQQLIMETKLSKEYMKNIDK